MRVQGHSDLLRDHRVEVIGRYSNFPQPLLSGQTDRLLRASTRQNHPKSPTPRVHTARRRLSPDTIQQLITDYQAGTPSTQLMLTYNLGKGTVLRLLRDHGVEPRRQRMSSDHIEQAIQLYQGGNSLVGVGAKLGYDHGTIYRALRRAGVSMRDSHGRHR